MALRIRFQYQTGSSLGYSIERLGDGTFFDFSNATFAATPVTLIATLPEDNGSFAGRFKVTLNTTPTSQFTNGNYVISVHNMAASNIVVGELSTVMVNGDDSPVLTADPWATALPGSYATGTAGAILGGNLDAKVSTRSIFAGGSVASVTAPVTVGVNKDKTGYVLAAGGLDSIAVETGVNARQALSPILAASAGVLLGSGTGTIIIKGGNVPATRITAAVDNVGNRTAVTLSLPT